ncbi:uncharacterized protein LOC8034269 isoform X2 [Ixodes scapularis]|uniref:uncharacterized protein LOC8034269 isoform X2 n=1 Tax=Ixodes scapularis TaxID=6945 RepID=UPI001A9F7479|nr:uncharacterized protein LOC8034269 isoform X2 [Ixodes scapularis]
MILLISSVPRAIHPHPGCVRIFPHLTAASPHLPKASSSHGFSHGGRGKMATQLGIGKSVAVLAVVVGCFSVLWPKIFFPMLQAVFYGTSPDTDTFAAEALRAASRDRNTNPRIREDMGQARPSDTARENRRGRPFPPVAMRTPPRPMAKTGGAMNLVMPLYTIGIVVFFVYTILQLACKKSPAESRTQTRVLPMDCPCEETIRQKLAARQLLRDYGGRQGKVPGSPAADASSFLRRGQRDQRDLEMEELRRRLANAEALVQELLLGREDPAESQRQAGLERRQERCCGAGSPARRATGKPRVPPSFEHGGRSDGCPNSAAPPRIGSVGGLLPFLKNAARWRSTTGAGGTVPIHPRVRGHEVREARAKFRPTFSPCHNTSLLIPLCRRVPSRVPGVPKFVWSFLSLRKASMDNWHKIPSKRPDESLCWTSFCDGLL